jgi:HAD superfamily hydrolase (TIGR01509 family)
MLFFDLDSTLIDSADVWLRIDLDFLERRGLVHTQEYHDFVAHSTLPSAAVYTKKYYSLPETPEDIVEEWKSMLRDAYGRTIPLKPFAREFVEKCRAGGETLAVITSNTPELCEAALDRFGILGDFTDFVYAEDFGLEKSDPELFSAALKKLGERPETSTLFDDSPLACAAAKSAGLRVVGVYDDFFAGREDEMRALCDRYIKNFGELL